MNKYGPVTLHVAPLGVNRIGRVRSLAGQKERRAESEESEAPCGYFIFASVNENDRRA